MSKAFAPPHAGAQHHGEQLRIRQGLGAAFEEPLARALARAARR